MPPSKMLSFLLFFLLPLSLLSQQPKLMMPIGHTSQVIVSNFSPDGKKVVTASMDITAKIWDAQSGALLADLKGHNGWVYSANFSADGKRVITSSRDNTAIIWDIFTGKPVKVLQGHTSYVYNAIYSPNGKMILTVSNDGTARLWDAISGSPIRQVTVGSMVTNASFSHDNKKFVTASLHDGISVWNVGDGVSIAQMKGHTDKVYTAFFSLDDKKILSASRDMTAKLWNAENGSLVVNMNRHTAGISSAFFSPDGKKIVTSSGDKTAIIWDGNTGAFLAELKHPMQVYSASFSHDSKMIATACVNGTAKIWNAANGKLLVDLSGHKGGVLYSNFSPDDKKIITASADGTAKIWDSQGKLITDLAGHMAEVYGIGYSPDGKKIVTGSSHADVLVWDAANGEIIQTLKGHTDDVYAAHYSFDGKRIVTASWDSTAKIWNASNGELLVNLKGHSAALNNANFSKDGRKVVTASFDGTAKIWDAIDGEELATIEDPDVLSLSSPELMRGEEEEVYNANFSPDGDLIVTASKSPFVPVWDGESGEMISYFPGHYKPIKSVCFSPDGKKVLSASKDYTAKIFDADNRKVLVEVNHLDNVSDANFSPDGNKFVTGSWDHTAKIWDSQNGKLLADLVGHKSNVCGVEFSPDGKRIISCSYDQTVKIWEAATGKLIYTFFAIDNRDKFLQDTSGYYFTTSTAAKLLHYVIPDLKVITFEQLDVKYNRPDKVLAAMGNTDTVLIKSYRQAWEKRMKKLGIDTTAFREGYSVPEADFANRAGVGYEQKKGMLSLRIKGNDRTYDLERFNVWVNEVPVYGQRGISIKRKNKNNLDTTISIKLSQGENKIETSVSNINGTESYRIPLIVNYASPSPQKQIIRFVGIGIDQFANPEHNLQYSSKDIRDLAKKFKEKFGKDVIIDTLFNEKVTVKNVKALKQKLLQTTENDKVIIAYSGHGLLSKEYDYYLSTYAVNFDKPAENGLPYEELENLLDKIPARKKLLLIDACHSGEVDKEDLVSLARIPDSLIKGVTPVAYKQEGQLGLKNSFELMQRLFVNVGKSTGATIISAAAGTQFALERNDLKNGVFTYCVLEAMNKYPSLKISELKKIVGERVEQLTNGQQKPTSRNETINNDWEAW